MREKAVAAHVAVCVPARDQVCTGFAHDLARLSARWYASAPPATRFDLNFNAGTLIADQRQKLAANAVKAGAEYILFLDSDMRFPPYLLEHLIARTTQSADVDIVACNYPTRRIPVKTVAFSDFTKLECIYSNDKSGLEEVDAIGMGAMLIKASVFERLPKPWFQICYLPTAGAYIGEDIYFCKLAQAHQMKVWVDHDLSKDVRHIGAMEFSHDHADACRETGASAGHDPVLAEAAKALENT
jgi:hypothetical protein